MSGGQFDYIQFKLDDVADDINDLIVNNKIPGEYGYASDYTGKALKEFAEAVRLIRRARVYIHRIDWLVSGDDDEDSFHKRLKEDLQEIENEKQNKIDESIRIMNS
jgi:hypothetical protein